MQQFKAMAKGESLRGKTLFAVSHGQFLNALVCHLTNSNRQTLESGCFNPNNNSLTVIDFDVEEKEHFRGDGMVTVVTPRLVAHNMQVIGNSSDTSPVDFEP